MGLTSKPAWPVARIDPDSPSRSEFLRGFSAVKNPVGPNDSWLTDAQHVDASRVVKIDHKSLTYQTQPLRSTIATRRFYASTLRPRGYFELQGHINQRALQQFKSVPALVTALEQLPMLMGQTQNPRQLFKIGYDLANIYRQSTTITGVTVSSKDLVQPLRPILMIRTPRYTAGELAGYARPTIELNDGTRVLFIKNSLADVYVICGGKHKRFYDQAMLLLARLHIERETLLALLTFLASRPDAFKTTHALVRKHCMDSAAYLTKSESYGYSLEEFSPLQQFITNLHREKWRTAMVGLELLDSQVTERVRQITYLQVKVEGDIVAGDQFRGITGSNIINKSPGSNVGSVVRADSTDEYAQVMKIVELLKEQGNHDEAALAQALQDSLGSPTQTSVGSAIWERVKQLGIVVSNFGSGLSAVDDLFN